MSAYAPEFATFWHGPLNPIAYGCLASFPHFGARLRLYSYDSALSPPPGVDLADARQVCPDETLLVRYRVGGKPSPAMFADMFRYKLIRDTGLCWVDTDVVCLRAPPDLAGEPIVFGRQAAARGKALINNAVLKLPADHPLLGALIRRSDAAVDVDQSWGAIGPFLLTDLAEQFGVDGFARGDADFYPIDADHFWQPLLPAYRDTVAKAAKSAAFLHLWSEMYERSGYDKEAAPAAGSFLHALFEKFGTLDRFARVYEEGELADLLEDWIKKDEELRQAAGS